MADPLAQENDKRNTQLCTEIPYEKYTEGRGQNSPIFISCRYLVELGLRQLGLPVSDKRRFDRTFWGLIEAFFGGFDRTFFGGFDRTFLGRSPISGPSARARCAQA